MPALLAPGCLWTDKKGLPLWLPVQATTSRRGMWWPCSPILFGMMWTSGLPTGLLELVPSCLTYPQKANSSRLPYRLYPLLLFSTSTHLNQFLALPQPPGLFPLSFGIYGWSWKPLRSAAAALNVVTACLTLLKPEYWPWTLASLKSSLVTAA